MWRSAGILSAILFKILKGISHDILGMFHQFFEDILGIFHQFFEDILGIFHQFFEDITEIF